MKVNKCFGVEPLSYTEPPDNLPMHMVIMHITSGIISAEGIQGGTTPVALTN